MIEHLKIHTDKFFGTWVVGTMAWVVEATNIIGMLGAAVGLFAGVMLVVIRWDDFIQSRPVKALVSFFSKRK